MTAQTSLFDFDDTAPATAPLPAKAELVILPPLRQAPAPIKAPRARKPVALGDSHTCRQRIIDRLARLMSVDQNAAGILAAWQQMVCCPRLWPAHAATPPPLADIDRGGLLEQWGLLAQIWPHLTDHAATADYVLERVAPADWVAGAAILDPAAVERATGVWGSFDDLGGEVRQQLRSPSDSSARGAFYTPTHLAAMIAQMAGPDPGAEPGQRYKQWSDETVYDPCCGTARLLAATVVRCQDDGADPLCAGWFGIDLDGPALAIAALNMIAVGAGPNVWLHRGDALCCSFTMNGRPLHYGLVVANPPFGGKVKPAELEPVEVPVDPAQRQWAWPTRTAVRQQPRSQL